LFRKGFQGVPLFMMISGVSLTIAAHRSGDALRWHRFLWARLRKLLVPYWAGVVITYGVILAVAWRITTISDSSFREALTGGVTISEKTHLQIDGGVAFASFALVPRLLQDEWFFAPQLALWFVGLLAQYYLLFPLLYVLMRKAGVAPFVLATLAVTVGANAWAVHEYAALELKFFLVTGWAPFRLFEFTGGMAIGWMLVAPEGRPWVSALRTPWATVGLVAVGLGMMVAGDLLIGWWTPERVVGRSDVLYLQALALPMVTLGLALLSLLLLVRSPSPSFAPVRALAFVGVISYAVLIVNDAMRLVASQIRVEDVGNAGWWLFLTVVYVPASVLLAWPLARVLGLLPASRRTPSADAESASKPFPAYAGAPAGGGGGGGG
jgi:peptidoglycan/LPS O-acetylase OafA/YrhL